MLQNTFKKYFPLLAKRLKLAEESASSQINSQLKEVSC